ncbi:hypothetical protein [Vibrio sp. H11]|uniref:hypothetical protein n=1 Tax=Vibrio sp. H11 TaxID=2565928 RepID=UPI0010A61DA7|nr:hypothetical protein [Vibrio sp. H11]
MKMIVVAYILPMIFLLSACGQETTKPTIKYERIGGQGKMHFTYIESGVAVSKKSYLQVGDYLCKDESVCMVMFWNNKSLTPASLPMTQEQVNAKIAHYNLNKKSGLHRVNICSTDGC